MAIARVNSDLQSQALIDYINSISDSAGYDKVAILFDKDPDGQTSAKLMKEILIRSGRMVEIVRALRHDEQRPDQELLEEIARKEITHIITLDLPIGEKREYWTAFSERRKLAIIDHHRTGKHGEESEG